MNEFKISVVIPAYNSSSTIERAVNSILCQTLLPYEIIIVNDCSTDNTLEVVNGLSKTIKTTVLTNEHNSGPSFSRNRGIKVAVGNWIAFLDADDFWHPQKLELQTKILKETKAKMIGGIAVFEESLAISLSTQDIKLKRVNKRSMLWKNSFQTPTVLIYKDPQLQFNASMSFGEDYELWTRMIKKFEVALSLSPALTYLGKKPYVKSGLSSNLMAMEKNEIRVLLMEDSLILKTSAILFSLFKFSLRFFNRFYQNLKMTYRLNK